MRMNFTKNLPKIETRSPMKSSTIQIQKKKYISLSKKKNQVNSINIKKDKDR